MIHKRERSTPIFLLLFLSVACDPVQTPGILQGEPRSELTVTHTVTLGDDDGPGMLGDPWGVESRNNGEWIVPDYYSPQRLRLFSADGTWIRAIGRHGEGPGEFELPGRVWTLDGDSLAVVDHMLRRITWFSPTFQVQEITRLPGGNPADKVLAMGRDMVVSDPNSGFGLIHYWSASDNTRTPIEPFPTAPDLGTQDTRRRNLPVRVHGAFWAAHYVQYRLERWSLNGELLQRVDREVDWFEPHDDWGIRPRAEGPPNPYITAIHEDTDGRVWVAILVPDPMWESAFGPGRGAFSGQERVTDINSYYDTIIEVIDPAQNRVLASARLDARIRAFTSAGDFYAFGESPQLSPVIRVYSGTLPM